MPATYRIIGLDFSIKRLTEKGRRLATLSVENTSVACLAYLIPYEAMDGMLGAGWKYMPLQPIRIGGFESAIGAVVQQFKMEMHFAA